MSPAILALDQGTTSSRAMLFDRDGAVLAVAQHELPQIYPAPGEVEHDPEEIWRTQLATARAVLAEAGAGVEVAAIGITNQRETTLVWERESGRPVANAIVWQSRVSEPICRRLREAGHEERIRAKTGLVVDPYFSGSKLQHLLDSVPGLRDRAERGEVLFGTVDSFLVWRLTGGRHHVTDVSNASRTLLFDLDALDWDDELLDLFGVPRAMLPQVRPTSAVYGETEPELLGVPLPIGSVVGDQQAATFGQACFEPGEAKNTYGTGAFLLVNTGGRPVRGARGLLATVGWQLGEETVYCLEGSVFVAGAVVQWLRDGLGLIASAGEVEALARRAEDSGGVYFVPAFVGLGAPWWDPAARGTIVGLSRGTRAEHLARAALDAIAFQTRDLVSTMEEAGVTLTSLKVDGGAAVNDLLLQLQADQLGIPVQRPIVTETTALGAAWLAGLAVGLYRDLDEVRALWRADRELQPVAPRAESDARYQLWRKAVACARAWAE